MKRRHVVSLFIGMALVPKGGIVASQVTIPPEFVALGVREDGCWVSPQFGVEVIWEAPYELNYVAGVSVFSNEVGDQFNIALPDDTQALFNVSITGPGNTAYVSFEDAEADLRNYEKSNDPVFLLFSATEDYIGALVVIEWGTSVLTGDDIPNQVLLFQTYTSRADPAVVIHTRIDARYKDIEPYVRALDTSVTVDGGPALRAFVLDEILEALDKLPPDGKV